MCARARACQRSKSVDLFLVLFLSSLRKRSRFRFEQIRAVFFYYQLAFTKKVYATRTMFISEYIIMMPRETLICKLQQ